jgi:hypothetical protein
MPKDSNIPNTTGKLFGFFLLGLLLMSSTAISAESENYLFSQLNPLYQEHTSFGVEFDYHTDPKVPASNAIVLKQDLFTQQLYDNISDPDPNEDNIISMIVHQTPSIQSTVLALEQVKRTHPLIGSIQWTSIVPYVKFLHHFDLPSGADVVFTQDFLGIALKVNGGGFNPEHYQLGYGNIPLEFLESLYEGKFSPDTSTTLTAEIHELPLGIRIDMTYSNLTYLFQTENIDFKQVSLMKIANKFILAQFEYITFSVTIRKYASFQIEGIETISEVSIGGVTNLIINEELPVEPIWTNSTQVEIEKTYNEVFTINETISWYEGPDIQKRLDLFSDISFSLLTAHNLGIFNETESLEDIQTTIDGQNRSATELNQADFPITDTIDTFHAGNLLMSAPVRGRNFVIQEEHETGVEPFIPAEIQTIALNQHDGFAGNELFSQETSLFRDLVVDSVKRFTANSNISSLTNDQLNRLSNLYFTDAQYKREFSLPMWTGVPFIFSSLQYAAKNSPPSNLITNGQITPFLFWPSVVLFLVLAVLPRKKGRQR